VTAPSVAKKVEELPDDGKPRFV